MKRRLLLAGFVVLSCVAAVSDGWVHAARCTPLSQGKCYACSNCRYCRHCAHEGGRCSVCK
jgi:hypothetical protein